MFSINYEDLNKLHLSIGISLIIGGIFLLFGNQWVCVDHFNQLPRMLQNNLEITNNFFPVNSSESIFKELTEFTRSSLELTKNICFTTFIVGSVTFIAGVFFFILGYIHFKKCELKKKV